jgi:UDP-GlcNAc:undecaprenyl-phosphate GlcNAc-1-phosphate transferase
MQTVLIYYFFSYLVVSVILSLLLVPLMRPLSFSLGALDRGKGRRVHKGIVPRLGGIGIFLAFLIPLAFSLTRGVWDDFHEKMVGILVALTVVMLIGVYDDIKGATIRNKLIAEVVAALIIYAWGISITVISNPFGGSISLGWLSLPLTVLWIIIVTNAVNLIDGLDGLAAGTGIFICATFFLLSGSDIHLQLTYVILAGSLLGFLRYNFPPASIFMGDSGSLFLGFFLAATSVLSSRKATAVVTIMIPIIAFSLPLMDMFYAVVRRYYRGIPLGEADREHIHHKLLDMGLSKRSVLFLLYAVNICLLLLVLFIVMQQLRIDFLIIFFLVILSIVGLRLLGYIEFLPTVKELMKNYEIGRKRKYFNYVIRRFRKNASMSMSLDDFWSHLDDLMKEYHFSSAEINLNIPSIQNPVYAFTNNHIPSTEDPVDTSSNTHKSTRPMGLAFPIIGPNNTYLGNIHVSKQMDDEYFLCTAEMVRALSEEVGRFLTNTLIVECKPQETP